MSILTPEDRKTEIYTRFVKVDHAYERARKTAPRLPGTVRLGANDKTGLHELFLMHGLMLEANTAGQYRLAAMMGQCVLTRSPREAWLRRGSIREYLAIPRGISAHLGDERLAISCARYALDCVLPVQPLDVIGKPQREKLRRCTIVELMADPMAVADMLLSRELEPAIVV